MKTLFILVGILAYSGHLMAEESPLAFGLSGQCDEKDTAAFAKKNPGQQCNNLCLRQTDSSSKFKNVRCFTVSDTLSGEMKLKMNALLSSVKDPKDVAAVVKNANSAASADQLMQKLSKYTNASCEEIQADFIEAQGAYEKSFLDYKTKKNRLNCPNTSKTGGSNNGGNGGSVIEN